MSHEEIKVEIEKHLKAAMQHQENARRHRELARQLSDGELALDEQTASRTVQTDFILPKYDPDDLKQHAAM